jgi:hypothetical protein
MTQCNEPIDPRLAAATEAIVEQHGEEIKAYLNGVVPANAWRPEQYAAAVLKALDALPGTEASK